MRRMVKMKWSLVIIVIWISKNKNQSLLLKSMKLMLIIIIMILLTWPSHDDNVNLYYFKIFKVKKNLHMFPRGVGIRSDRLWHQQIQPPVYRWLYRRSHRLSPDNQSSLLHRTPLLTCLCAMWKWNNAFIALWCSTAVPLIVKWIEWPWRVFAKDTPTNICVVCWVSSI